MKKANCDAAHKRATLAEQKLASADARSLQLEADFQRWRSTMQHQADCHLQQEVAKLMAEKEACNVTIQKESVERNMLIVNIQQLKTNEQRLVCNLWHCQETH